MIDTLLQRARDYFQNQLGISLDALLAPIDPERPAGKPVRGNGVYTAIEQARRQDDPTLPLGPWEHELKRADWGRVSSVALEALAHTSKDLQLAGWLLEAQINTTGFAGIAACMMLIRTLCERYWDDMYPRAEGGDLEYRANIIHWVDEKLLPALRMVPITSTGRERDYSWADWELARRNEQLRAAAAASRDRAEVEGVTMHELAAAMAATSSDAYLWLYQTLGDALDAIAALSETIDRSFGADAPSLMTLAGLLEQIRHLAESELHKRGLQTEQPEPAAAGAPQLEHDGEAPIVPSSGAIRDRADAYARLAEAAQFLMRLEPHSPVPYLVKRATEWGRMNTAELYQELFIRLNGQLNIFDMLGLGEHAEQT